MRGKVPTYCGIYLLKQSTAEKSYKLQYALKVGYGKNIASRLEKYKTHNAFFDLIATKQVPETRVQQIENYYQKQLAKIGTLVPGTKEWFYVTKEDYNYITKKGFKGLETMQIVLDQEFYGTNELADLCKKYFMGSKSDWNDVDAHTINSRMNQAIFKSSLRSEQLRELAALVKSRQGINSEGNTKGCVIKFKAQEAQTILTDETFNPKGLDKQDVQAKWVYKVDNVVMSQPKTEKIQQPKIQKTATTVSLFNDLKYNGDISHNQNKANRKQIEIYLNILNTMLEEYTQEKIFNE